MAGHVTAFAEILTGRRGDRLDARIAAVDADNQPDRHPFTAGRRRNDDAVRDGLTTAYSSGPVEGHVNRINGSSSPERVNLDHGKWARSSFQRRGHYAELHAAAFDVPVPSSRS